MRAISGGFDSISALAILCVHRLYISALPKRQKCYCAGYAEHQTHVKVSTHYLSSRLKRSVACLWRRTVRLWALTCGKVIWHKTATDERLGNNGHGILPNPGGVSKLLEMH